MASLFGSIAYELGHGFAGKMGEIWKDFFYQSSENRYEFTTDASHYWELGENYNEPTPLTVASLKSKLKYENVRFFLNLSSLREANVFGIEYLPSRYKRLLISSMIKEDHVATLVRYKFRNLLDARAQVAYQFVAKKIEPTGMFDFKAKDYGLHASCGLDEIEVKVAWKIYAATKGEASFQYDFITKKHAIGIEVTRDIKDFKLGVSYNNLAFEREAKNITLAGEVSKDYMGSHIKVKVIVNPFSHPKNSKIGFAWETME